MPVKTLTADRGKKYEAQEINRCCHLYQKDTGLQHHQDGTTRYKKIAVNKMPENAAR
jgi:hypothetical protein